MPWYWDRDWISGSRNSHIALVDSQSRFTLVKAAVKDATSVVRGPCVTTIASRRVNHKSRQRFTDATELTVQARNSIKTGLAGRRQFQSDGLAGGNFT